MVHALQEARRVLTPRGVLIDVLPVLAPIVVEVVVAAQSIWAKTVETYSAPDDLAAAGVAVQQAVAAEWFAFEKSQAFDFQIDCDTVAELKDYAESRKLCGAAIPYDELEECRRALATPGQPVRLRCRRPWKVTAYRRK
jgi:hypothetical protein